MFSDPQVNYDIHDVDAAVRFYAELFGFEETFRAEPDRNRRESSSHGVHEGLGQALA